MALTRNHLLPSSAGGFLNDYSEKAIQRIHLLCKEGGPLWNDQHTARDMLLATAYFLQYGDSLAVNAALTEDKQA